MKSSKNNCICIITARGGSKRISKKNIKDFCGKPIISYSIETAIKSNLFDEVMVSTDDQDIAKVSKVHGANIPFFRSKKNSDDYSSTAEVIFEVLEEYKKLGYDFQYACCIYPTAPLLQIDSLINGFDLLKNNELDTVFPVLRFGFPIQRALRMDINSVVSMVQPENLTKRSQDLEPTYHDAGQFYFLNVERFMKSKKLLTEKSAGIVLNEMDAQDIDTEEDWDIAEFKYQYRRNINQGNKNGESL